MSEDDEIIGNLLRSRLRLEEQVQGPVKDLKAVNDRLRELLRKRGREFVDEELRLVAFVEERPRWIYDVDAMLKEFGEIATREGLISGAVNIVRLEELIDQGLFTRQQLQQAGVMVPQKLIPTLLVKPWKGGV